MSKTLRSIIQRLNESLGASIAEENQIENVLEVPNADEKNEFKELKTTHIPENDKAPDSIASTSSKNCNDRLQFLDENAIKSTVVFRK